MHWQRAGHAPIALIGGGTGLIGDPSGQGHRAPAARRASEVEANVAGQRAHLRALLDFDAQRPNARAARRTTPTGSCKLGFLEVLRDVGKHFSVNAMIQKDSVRARLENREQGISYTEFSYMLLQAYDFLHLTRTLGCTRADRRAPTSTATSSPAST